MKRDITEGEWIVIRSEYEHGKILSYGKLDAKNTDNFARVQIGKFTGPGYYLILSYQERCPRNCCYDSVREIIDSKGVALEVKEKITELAGILKNARKAVE